MVNLDGMLSLGLTFWVVTMVNDITNVEISKSSVINSELCFDGVISTKCAKVVTHGWQMYLKSSHVLSKLNSKNAIVVHSYGNSTFVLANVASNSQCSVGEMIRVEFSGCTHQNNSVPQMEIEFHRNEKLCPKITPPRDHESVHVPTILVHDNDTSFQASLNIVLPVTVQGNWVIYLAVSTQLSKLYAAGVSSLPKKGDIFTLTNMHWQDMFLVGVTHILQIDGLKATHGVKNPCITAMFAWEKHMEVRPSSTKFLHSKMPTSHILQKTISPTSSQLPFSSISSSEIQSASSGSTITEQLQSRTSLQMTYSKAYKESSTTITHMEVRLSTTQLPSSEHTISQTPQKTISPTTPQLPFLSTSTSPSTSLQMTNSKTYKESSTTVKHIEVRPSTTQLLLSSEKTTSHTLQKMISPTLLQPLFSSPSSSEIQSASSGSTITEQLQSRTSLQITYSKPNKESSRTIQSSPTIHVHPSSTTTTETGEIILPHACGDVIVPSGYTYMETTVVVLDNWPQGFKAAVKFTTTTEIRDGWRVVLVMDNAISLLTTYDVTPTPNSGTRFTLHNKDYIKHLERGRNVTVEFLATKEKENDDVPCMRGVLMWAIEKPCQKIESIRESNSVNANVTIISQWNEGISGKITVVVPATIQNGWQMKVLFDTPLTLTVHQAISSPLTGTQFTLTNESYNKVLQIGTILEITFTGTKNETGATVLCTDALFIW